MHSHTLDDWRHEHVFLGAAHDRNTDLARLSHGTVEIHRCDAPHA